MTNQKEDDFREHNDAKSRNPAVAIARCCKWALPMGIILAGATAVYLVSSFEPKFRARALFESYSYYLLLPGVMPNIQNLAKSEKALIFSAVVLDAVLADPNLRDAPSLSNSMNAESMLRNNLTVETFVTESQMVISYEDTDSKAAALVCNAVSESYLRHRDLFDRKRVESLVKWLAPEIARWEQEVEERRNRLVQLSQQVLGYDPNNLLQTAGFEDHLTSARALSRRIDDISLEIKIFDAQLDLGVDKVEQEGDSDSPERTHELDESQTQSAKEMIRKRELLVAELGVLKEKSSNEKSKLERFKGKTAELQFSKDELATANDVLVKLRNREAAIRTEIRQDSVVRLLATATPPSEPIESLPLRRIAVVSLVAFLIPFVLGYLFGGRPRRVAV